MKTGKLKKLAVAASLIMLCGILAIKKFSKDETTIAIRQTNESGARKYLGESINKYIEDSLMCKNAESYEFKISGNDTILEIERSKPLCISRFENREIYFHWNRENFKDLPPKNTNDKSQEISIINKKTNKIVGKKNFRLEIIAMEKSNTWICYFDPESKSRDPYLNFQFYNDTLVRIWSGF